MSSSARAGSGLAPSVLALLTSTRRAAQLGRDVHEVAPVRRVGHVAGDRRVRPARQRADRLAERALVAGVEDEVPAAGGQLLGEDATEAPGGAGDDGDRSLFSHATKHETSTLLEVKADQDRFRDSALTTGLPPVTS